MPRKAPTAYPIPADGLCLCGCGKPTPVAKRSRYRSGWVAGQPKPFVPGHKLPRIALGEQWIVQPDGCWIWQGPTTNDGYAIVTRQGRHRLVYAVNWEAKNGPKADGLKFDHLCHTRDKTCPGGPGCLHRRCVNSDHVEPVTDFENSRRGVRTVLTWEKVRAIRDLRGESDFREVARQFGIKWPTYVHKIWANEVWRE